MKILHVVSSNQRRGAEVFAFDLMRHLGLAGVDQRVAVLRVRPEGLEYPAPTTDLKANGLGASFASMMRLDRAIRGWRPDLVQTHGGEVLTFLLPTLLGTGRPPVVHRRIGLTPHWMAGPMRKRVHGLPIRRSAAVIAVGDAVANQVIEEFRVPRSLVVTIVNAVDESRVRPTKERSEIRRDLGVSEQAAVALFAGALNDEKSPFDLIEIARRVTRDVADVHFLLAGDGPLAGDLRRAADEAGLGARVRLLGPRSDVANLLLASDALVMTSRTEGMPAALIEAGLAGRAVAAYAVGGVPEVIIDDVTGVVAAPGDRTGLAAGLLGLLADPRRRHRLGARARMRCRELFEIRAVAGLYLDLYESIAARGRRRPLGVPDHSATLKESLDES